MLFTTFALFDCRWPMKCQRNVSPYSACFASRSCARFSPTTSTPASASTRMSATETYFVAATTVTLGPTSSRNCSYRSRTPSGEIPDHSLPSGHAAVAAMREELLGVTRRAQVDSHDRRDARGLEGAFRRCPQVERAPLDDVAPEPGTVRSPDLVAHLVAARPDPGPDHRARGSAERCDTRL